LRFNPRGFLGPTTSAVATAAPPSSRAMRASSEATTFSRRSMRADGDSTTFAGGVTVDPVGGCLREPAMMPASQPMKPRDHRAVPSPAEPADDGAADQSHHAMSPPYLRSPRICATAA
jgi:hypothetical protein